MKPHQPWGAPAGGPPDREVTGSDADLAAVAATAAGGLVRFRPGPASDFGRALGLGSHGPSADAPTEVAVDVLALDGTPGPVPATAVNAVVVGAAPGRLGRWQRRSPVTVTIDGTRRYEGRATTVVVASGQYLHGADVVPRGHPGDGRVEVQVYELAPGERRPMRARLPQGGHVPHPRIQQLSGRAIEVAVAGRPWPLEVDGEAAGAVSRLAVAVRPGALRLLL